MAIFLKRISETLKDISVYQLYIIYQPINAHFNEMQTLSSYLIRHNEHIIQ